jgi:hypothetical protein
MPRLSPWLFEQNRISISNDQQGISNDEGKATNGSRGCRGCRPGYSNKTEFQFPMTNKKFPMTKERPMNRGNAGAAALVIRTKQDFNIQQPTRNFQ